MKKWFRDYLRMTKYEMIRVCRNRVLLISLLLFAVVIMGIMSQINMSQINAFTTSMPVAIFTNGKEIEDINSIEIFQTALSMGKVIYVDSIEDGTNLVKSGDVCILIAVDTSTTPESFVCYYDGSSNYGYGVFNSLFFQTTKYGYQSIEKFLSDYGITLNEDALMGVRYESTTPNKNLTLNDISFPLYSVVVLAITLMYGMAYSISRDNETNVSKNLKYLPIGKNKYLLSKMTPFVILGLIVMSLLLLVGAWGFHIVYATNVLLILCLSILFMISTLLMAFILSMFTSQIVTVIFEMVSVLLPLIIFTMAPVKSFSSIIQALFYLFPETPFIVLMSGSMFNGYINVFFVIMQLMQVVIYYLISVILLSVKSRSK